MPMSGRASLRQLYYKANGHIFVDLLLIRNSSSTLKTEQYFYDYER